MIRYAYGAVALAAGVVPAEAANYTYDVLVPVAGLPAGGGTPYFSDITPVDLGVGDTIDLTFRFAGTVIAPYGGFSVTAAVLGPNFRGPHIQPFGTATYEYINPVAIPVTSGVKGTSGSVPSTINSQLVVLGVEDFYRENPRANPGESLIAFDGFRTVITINSQTSISISDPMNQKQTYSIAYFRVLPNQVPEPATWAMMILGFGMIGAASRARHNRTYAVNQTRSV